MTTVEWMTNAELAECTKCGHSIMDGHEVTDYWAARRWNEAIKKMKEKTDA